MEDVINTARLDDGGKLSATLCCWLADLSARIAGAGSVRSWYVCMHACMHPTPLLICHGRAGLQGFSLLSSLL